ncbi:hypothetical protein DLAC_00859 [Tieghemostelium lacteum]|uniref:F-box domain-containing protein n=1 Tax=Tieghemostelium lacteum TaxID=361077 RepID=A0A152A756_TIELA|nr:hypothetical protein DLAC_00859 [Tieghemostelium lacteum]|eukprot:KYR02059.1 hypothetical protein DLAC_00859 [Tieghemostelium lacteum]
MMRIPLLLVYKILNYIIDTTYIPLKYKLTLGLICKQIFQKIRSNNKINKTTRWDTWTEDDDNLIESHRDSEHCIIKDIENLFLYFDITQKKIDIDFVDKRLERLGRDVQTLKVLEYNCPLNYHFYPNFIRHFPKLVTLELDLEGVGSYNYLYWIETETKVELPPIENLNIRVNEDILFVQWILTKIKMSIVTMVIHISGYLPNHLSEPLNIFIGEYQAPNLKSIDCPKQFPLDKLILNHQSHLTSFVINYPLWEPIDVIVNQKNMPCLEEIIIHTMSSKLLHKFVITSISQMPQLRKLRHTSFCSLANGDTLTVENQPLKYIQELEIQNPNLFNYLLSKNMIGNQLVLLKIDCLNSQSYELLNRYLSTTDKLSHLHFDCAKCSYIQSEILSRTISKMPSLIALNIRVGNQDNQIFNHLHLSETLDFISIRSYELLYPITIHPPFQLITSGPSLRQFLRNGIHYNEISQIITPKPTIFSKFLNFFTHK